MPAKRYKPERYHTPIVAKPRGKSVLQIGGLDSMKYFIWVLIVTIPLVLSGCGSEGSCVGVDTSQAPDSIIRGAASDTYYWGNGCSKTYPK